VSTNACISGNCARPWSRTSPPGGQRRSQAPCPRRQPPHCRRRRGDNPPVFSTTSQNVMAAALLFRAMPEPSTPEGRRGYAASWSKPWNKTQKALHHSPTTQGQDTRGINPLPTRYQRCRAQHPLIRKGALKPRLSTNALRPMWMPGPPLRPAVVIGTRPSLDGTDRTEAEGTTPTTTAARHQSLRVLASSAMQSAGPSSYPGSDSPLTSPSTQGKLILSSGKQTTA